MKKFIVTYHASKDALEQMKDKSPEDMKKGMEMWHAWAEKCGEHLVDMGSPLAGGMAMDQSGSKPSEKQVCGYSILQAESMEAAMQLLEGHPHLGWDSSASLEVHECMPMPDQ